MNNNSEKIASEEHGTKLIVEADGFTGPLDLLLQLAQKQKVDVSKISILSLAEQYFDYVAKITKQGECDIEQLADYLVMAAMLAYLKSRILLPDDDEEEELSAEEEIKLFAFRATRFKALMKASTRLFEREYRGRDFFLKGMSEEVSHVKEFDYRGDQFKLFKAYGNIAARNTEPEELRIAYEDVFSSHEIYDVLVEKLFKFFENDEASWLRLESIIDDLFEEVENKKSLKASSFVASLELVKEGQLRIKQNGLFNDLFIRQVNE